MRFTAIVERTEYQDLLDPPQFLVVGWTRDRRQGVRVLTSDYIPPGQVVEVTIEVKELGR
jgi:hypothetical protein